MCLDAKDYLMREDEIEEAKKSRYIFYENVGEKEYKAERKHAIHELRRFLARRCKGMQAFTTQNLVGDRMQNIYEDSYWSIYVDECWDYDYIEIFGLTDEEYKSLCMVKLEM